METAQISFNGKYWILEGMETGIEFAICDTKQQCIDVANEFVADGSEISAFVIED